MKDCILGALLVIFILVSLAYCAKAQSDCRHKGGELVRKASGFYSCAKVIK